MYRDNVIKLTHIPTGIEITVSNSRSQHKNRELALKILRSKLWALNNGAILPDLNHIVVATYDLTDGYKDELYEYRESENKL